MEADGTVDTGVIQQMCDIRKGPLNTLRTDLFKLFKRPFPGFLTILTL